MKIRNFVPIVLMIARLFGSGTILAADCKYEINSKDKFTKVHTLQTKWDSLTSWHRGFFDDDYTDTHVAARSINGDKTLRVRITAFKLVSDRPRNNQLHNLIVVPDGSHLWVSFADETYVGLAASGGRTSKSSYAYPGTEENPSGKFSISSAIEIDYTLDDDTAKLLMAQDATQVLVETAGRSHDVKIHNKSLGDIRQAVSCIQESS